MQSQYVTGKKGSKGSSSARTPVEEATSLRSNSVIHMIHVLSEGQIVGFSDSPMKDIIISDTPVQSETNDTDGSPLYNYNGIDFQFRAGTPDQDPVTGFAAAENEISVGAEVKFGKPITRSVTNTDADAVRITVTFPSTVDTDKSSGDSRKTTIEYAVDIQPTGGQFYEAGHWTQTFKNTSAVQKSHRIQLTGKGPWNVRLRRITADSTTQYLQNGTTFASFTEIVDGKFTYPNVAYVALRAIADQFGNTSPTCKYRIKGRIIKVPSNYDPEARTYTGIWDGTFKLAWSNNPAWCFYDMATNNLYGMGRTKVDKWSLYRIGRECDVMVSDGKGGTEPRFTLNVTIKDQKSAMTLMDSLASAFRGMAYWGKDRSGSMLIATQDVAKSEDGQKFFGPSNIVGTPRITGARAQDRHTVANVTWRDISSNSPQSVIEQVKLNKAINALGWNETSVSPIGCTSQSQAQRYGHWILATEYTESESISFATGYEYAYDLAVGEVIRVHVDWRQTANLSGRVFSTAAQGDRWLHLDAAPEDTRGGVWTITLHMPDNDFFSTKITEFDGNRVKLAEALPADVVRHTTWVVESQSSEHSLWRVSGVDIDDDGAVLTVSATAYNPAKFKYVDEGANLDDMVITGLPTGAVAAPTNVTVLPRTYLNGGTMHQGFTVGWTMSDDIRVVGYTVETMAPDETVWTTRGGAAIPPLEVDDERSGLWKVRVIAFTELNQFSPWAYAETQVSSYLQPLPPDTVTSTSGNFQITVQASNSQRTDQEYEFWRATTALEGADKITTNAIRVGMGRTITDSGLEPGVLYYYYLRGTNAYGVSSFYPYQAKTTFNPQEIVDILHGQLGESALSKELANKINNPDIALDGFDTRFNGIEKNLETVRSNVADVKSGVDTVTQSTKTLATRVDTVASTMDNLNAAIKREESARVAGQEAVVKTAQDMVATADGKSRSDWGAAISKESLARSDAISSKAQELSTLIANAVGTSESKMAAQIETEKNARAEGDEAEASERKTLASKVNESAAAIRQITSATTENQKAIANLETNVVAQLDEKVASVTQQMSAEIDEVSGTMKSMYVVKLQAGTEDVVAGFGLAMNEDDLSDFAIRADRFYVTNETGSKESRTPVFSVQDNKVYISEAVIGTIKVTSGMIDDELQSANWVWRAERDFDGMELNFKEGQIRCDDVILKGSIEATEFKAYDQVGNYTCEVTGRGIVVKRGDMLIARMGIWGD